MSNSLSEHTFDLRGASCLSCWPGAADLDVDSRFAWLMVCGPQQPCGDCPMEFGVTIGKSHYSRCHASLANSRFVYLLQKEYECRRTAIYCPPPKWDPQPWFWPSYYGRPQK